MAVDFQLELTDTLLLIRNYQGDIEKASKEVPVSFYSMEFLGNNIYIDNQTGMVWRKKANLIVCDECQYIQEEYTNVTELWKENKKLLYALNIDPLTKISNVRAVEDKKKEILSTGKSCVLVMSDINSFKSINDTYGHLIGDQCLTQIAELFNHAITDSDLVARVGGDEFFFVFETDDIGLVTEKMNRIQEGVIKLGKSSGIPLSISIGISLFQQGDNWEQRKAEADSNSYNNKQRIKNMCI